MARRGEERVVSWAYAVVSREALSGLYAEGDKGMAVRQMRMDVREEKARARISMLGEANASVNAVSLRAY